MPKYKPQNIPQNGAQKKAEDMTTKKTRGCGPKVPKYKPEILPPQKNTKSTNRIAEDMA
jgi:hypothetical protein